MFELRERETGSRSDASLSVRVSERGELQEPERAGDTGVACQCSECESNDSGSESSATLDAWHDAVIEGDRDEQSDTEPGEGEYSLLRQLQSRAGARLVEFPEGDEHGPVDAGGSTLAIFLAFEDGGRMKECWRHLYHTARVSTDVWLSGQTMTECFIIFLPDLDQPLSGKWALLDLEREAEMFLGCHKSRSGRRPVLLRQATMTVEVLPQSGRQQWIEERESLLRDCRRIWDLSETEPEGEAGQSTD
ncbi:hypothetical protein DER44DRAFT_803519 [Fusarium oxysporum]|nr:hypothetical protein DER44DRAFT_803519 [Fusarium oxysporum]